MTDVRGREDSREAEDLVAMGEGQEGMGKDKPYKRIRINFL